MFSYTKGICLLTINNIFSKFQIPIILDTVGTLTLAYVKLPRLPELSFTVRLCLLDLPNNIRTISVLRLKRFYGENPPPPLR